MIKTDEQAWRICKPEHRWVFNKLEIAKRMGYVCDPSGFTPTVKDYVVRPVMNLEGMGIGATFGGSVPAGYFWQERFYGVHLSVDYSKDGEVVLCVRGERKSYEPIYKWHSWEKVDPSKAPPLPEMFKDILSHYGMLNIEFIGEKVVEVHLRHNPDPLKNYRKLYPVWEQKTIFEQKGDFIKDYVSVGEVTRYGFIGIK